MLMNKIVTLDFDGTIFDTWTRFMEIAKEHYPETVIHDDVGMIKTHGFAPALNMTNEQIHEIFKREDFYIDGYFLDGFKELYDHLLENGYKTNILTVGGDLNNFLKAQLMKEVGYDRLTLWSITFMGKSVNFDKGQYDGKNGIFVDDRVKCLDTVQNATKFRMAYNGACLDEDGANRDYPVLNNMHDLLDYIKMLEDSGCFKEEQDD